MTNLVDIPIIVSTLFTFFSSGGTAAAIEALKGITVNGVLKLSELKDDLLLKPEVERAVQQCQQNPLDENLREVLKEVIKQAVQQHPAISTSSINADHGSIGINKANKSTITINNKF